MIITVITPSVTNDYYQLCYQLSYDNHPSQTKLFQINLFLVFRTSQNMEKYLYGEYQLSVSRSCNLNDIQGLCYLDFFFFYLNHFFFFRYFVPFVSQRMILAYFPVHGLWGRGEQFIIQGQKCDHVTLNWSNKKRKKENEKKKRNTSLYFRIYDVTRSPDNCINLRQFSSNDSGYGEFSFLSYSSLLAFNNLSGIYICFLYIYQNLDSQVVGRPV